MSALEGRSVLRWRLQVPCGIQRQPLQDASMLHRPPQCGTPETPRQQTGCSRSGRGKNWIPAKRTAAAAATSTTSAAAAATAEEKAKKKPTNMLGARKKI